MRNPARYWKDQVIFKQVDLSDLPLEIRPKCFYLEKIDGELNAVQFNGKKSKLITVEGTTKEDLPLLNEYTSRLSNVYRNCELVGEVVAVKNGKILPFNKSMSIIKTAYRIPEYRELVHQFVFDIVSINGKTLNVRNQTNYRQVYNILSKLFRSCKYIHVPRMIEGDLSRAWKLFVEKDKREGLVVRCPKRVYKIKESFTFDVVIIKVGNKLMKSWSRNQISYIVVAFLDRKGYFRVLSKVGTGFKDWERSALFKWAEQNMVDEDNEGFWVRPTKVVEVQCQEYFVQDRPTYRFTGKKYELVGNLESCTLRLPRKKRDRNDKVVSFRDIGIHQVPELNG